MAALLNFALGGGLLALVQAALSAWGAWQAKQSGANENSAKSAGKVISDVESAQNIARDSATLDSGAIADGLREFTRD